MVIPRGIEPLLPPWKGGVLTSWPRDQMAPPVGLEPTTLRLTAACSTSWAIEEYLKSAKGQTKICSFAKLFWQRLMFPGSHPPSIFSAEKLNFCVRYGYRCVHHAIITRSSLSSILQDTQNQIVVLSIQARLPFRSSPRPISISPLNTSPCLHSWPIYLIVFKGSYLLAQWEISSWSGFHT